MLENNKKPIYKHYGSITYKKEFKELWKGLETMEYRTKRYESDLNKLGLSTRAFNCLFRGGIQSIDELKTKTYNDLRRIRNVGYTSLREYYVCLLKYDNTKLDYPEHFVATISIANKDKLSTYKEAISILKSVLDLELVVTPHNNYFLDFNIHGNTLITEKSYELLKEVLEDEI